MNPDKWNVSIKSLRKREYLLAVVFGVFPLICAWIYCLKDGHSISDVYLPMSYWNDELFYYKQVEGIVHYGLPQGWFGFQEAHGSIYPFAAWSPVILLPWVIWGKLFGWNLLSPVYSNIVFNMLAMAGFALLVKPNIRTSAVVLSIMALFTPYSRYLLCGMPEAIYMALGILMVALTVSQIRKESAWKLGWMLAVIAFLTLGRPYLGMLFLIPIWFVIKNRSVPGILITALVVAVSAIGYVVISKTCSSPYFEPIVTTEWLGIFTEEGPGAGIAYMMSTLWEKTVLLFDYYLKLAVKHGLFSGALFAAVGLTAIVLGIRALWLCPWPGSAKRTDRPGQEYWIFALLQFVITAGMILALFLFYRMGEGSKHLMIFIVMSLLWIALLEEKWYIMKVGALFMCLYFFVIKAWVPYDWQVPYDDGTMKAEAQELSVQLEQHMMLADSEDRYDNTVIWLASDMIGEESVTASWGLLYTVPEGFGINFCLQDHVMENIDALQSKYIAVLPGGEVEKQICSQSGELIAGTERMRIYRLR